MGSTPGKVISLRGLITAGSVSLLQITPTLNYATQKVIITRVQLQQQSSAQFSHMFGNAIAVYVFGDRVGSIQISGTTFAASCDSAGAGGLGLVMDYYKNNRIAAVGDQASQELTVTIGQRAIRGFLMGVMIDMVDPERRMVNWALTLTSVPEIS